MVSKKDIIALAKLLNKLEGQYLKEDKFGDGKNKIQLQISGVNDAVDALGINFDVIRRAQKGEKI